MSTIKNVIFIMLDTLQFNYLGCYGNKSVQTPNFDRFARNGVLFENAYSEGLPTVPVRRALMTGRYTLPFAGWQALSSGTCLRYSSDASTQVWLLKRI